MSRTNVDIDDELIERVMRRYNQPSKRATIEMALRRVDLEPMSIEEALAMQGTGWGGDLAEIRRADAGLSEWLDKRWDAAESSPGDDPR